MITAPISQAVASRLMRLASLASVGAALLMIVLKFYAFLATDAVSLLSTLFDSALDAAASLVNLVAIRQALMPPDREHRFGHGKAEPLAGLVQVAFILGSSLLLLVEVFNHFRHPVPVARTDIGIVVMLISIAVTGGLLILQRHVVRRTGSIAIHADAAHYSSDFAVNIAVIAALLTTQYSGIWWVDPAFGLIVALFIAYAAINAARSSFDMLMDREMDDTARDEIIAIVRRHKEQGVLGLHQLRTRAAGRDVFVQFHLELKDDISLKEAHRISDAVEADLKTAFPMAEIIIHQDPSSVVTARAEGSPM